MLFFTFFPYNRFLFCSHIHWMNLPLNFAIGIALKFVPSTNKCALFSYYIFGLSARVWFKPLAARCDEYFFYIYMKKSNPKFIAFNWCLSCKISLNTPLHPAITSAIVPHTHGTRWTNEQHKRSYVCLREKDVNSFSLHIFTI